MDYLKKANNEFLKKNYKLAREIYIEALNERPDIYDLLKFNIYMCDRRMRFLNGNEAGGIGEVNINSSPIVNLDNNIDEMSVIKSSNYFNDKWYLNEYKDVQRKGVDPLKHFIKNGGREGRNPGPNFDTKWYLLEYKDASESLLNPLVHFLLYGQGKGYYPTPPTRIEEWWGGVRGFERSAVSDAPLPHEHDFLKIANRLNQIFQSVSVVIPVYNAPKELRNCLSSVAKYSSEASRIIIIDDCSSDKEVKEIIKLFKKEERFEFYSNSRNLGFTKTVNKGFLIAGSSDVVLLNADTEVAAGWIRRLKLAAYSADKIGTVTPLSNNAGAFSVPNVGEENEIPVQGINSLARAIAQTSLRVYPKVPTGNGFCMYIRRDCLNDVGGFDDEAFPRGYGEENDFCMRAGLKGWINIIDDSTYIKHIRSVSFGLEKNNLIKSGRKVLDQRYPQYTELVRSFIKSNEMEIIRNQVQKILSPIGRLGARVKPRVLYVLPALSKQGGTPQTNQDLMLALSDRVEAFFLSSNGACVEIFYFKNGIYKRLESFMLSETISPFPHRSEEYDRILASWLVNYEIELVHIRHIAWHSLGLIDVSKALGLPVVFSFHDFYTICPTVKLLDEKHQYCGGACTQSAGECKYDLWKGDNLPELKKSGVFGWRQIMREVLFKCDALVTTSESGKALILKNLKGLESKRFDVIPHGRDFPDFFSHSEFQLDLKQKLRVIIPGNIGYAKGAGVLNDLARYFSDQIEFHVLGRLTQGKLVNGVVEHGEYAREEFADRVKLIRPHLGAVLSIWPETYSHTLTELWATGVPVVGLPLGAIGERIQKTGAGWLAADTDVDSVIKIFQNILDNPLELKLKRSKVLEWQKKEGEYFDTGWMSDQYYNLYTSLTPLPSEGVETLGMMFEPGAPRKVNFRGVLAPSFSSSEMVTVSVIVPVHNALEDVKACLLSLVKHTFPAIELIVIDDGSGTETMQWIECFCRDLSYIKYYRNEVARGYTCAVNQGAKVATGEVLVILNSDTILPPYWLERLVDPFSKNVDVAATGPISNAATWQSVPNVKNLDNTWAYNSLPADVSIADYDNFIQINALDIPESKVDLLNGFCYAVRASVFKEVGFLDEKEFPSGYGEETDLFLKIKENGYKLTLIPDLFVFHHKSRSFGSERRSQLSAKGNQILYKRYKKEVVEKAAKTLAENGSLNILRSRIKEKISFTPFSDFLNILFIMPVAAGGGGVHSVIQEVEGMRDLGHHATILIPEKYSLSYENYYPSLCNSGGVFTFTSDHELVNIAKYYDVIVATHFLSVRLLKKAYRSLSNKLFMYYVQDYEPWIVEEKSKYFEQAIESYTEFKNIILMAKTRWLCRVVEKNHGVKVHKIAPSIDHSIYYSSPSRESVCNDRPLVISAMIRPKTPRRGPEATIRILKKLYQEFGNGICIELFGCTTEEIEKIKGINEIPYVNRGVLTREGVADLLRKVDLFIDMSEYQAFGRTAVEAMACGAAAVIPNKGGSSEYSWGGRTALAVPTENLSVAAQLIVSLLKDRDELDRRQKLGQKISSQFSIEKASLSILELIKKHIVFFK